LIIEGIHQMASPSQTLVLKFNTDLAAAQDNIAKFAAKAYLDFEKISSAAKNAKTVLDFVGKNSLEITGLAAIGGRARRGRRG
jgi:phage-related minor tail protein